MITLEKYNGPASRHTCPACGAKRRFTRYINTETGRYLADHVGRCDRESSCGYHLGPREYLGAIGGVKQGSFGKDRRTGCGPRAAHPQKIAARTPDLIRNEFLIETLADYEHNDFVQFLFRLFPADFDDVFEAVKDYRIGTGPNGEAIFWQIDHNNQVRTGKVIAYDRGTGRRRKDRKPDWMHSVLKRAGTLAEGFAMQQCFFGEHLLSKYPNRPIAIVEAEKTAVIASICKGVFPDLVWLACGGKSNLTPERIARLGRHGRIILYPDADGFDKWQSIVFAARRDGIDISISTLIHQNANQSEKSSGCDLADFLIREQQKRNDPARREAFRDLIEERLAIMTIDGGLSESEAEHAILNSGSWHESIRTVCLV